MKLQDFDSLLKSVCQETYELAAPKGKARYVVWHRYGGQYLSGDDRNLTGLPKVQIDIVTNLHGDTLAEDVGEALGEACLPYSLESEGYDPEYTAYRTVLHLVLI